MIVQLHRPESPIPRRGMVGMEFVGITGQPVERLGTPFAAQRDAIRHARSWSVLLDAAQAIWTYRPGSYERDTLCSAVTARTFTLAGPGAAQRWGSGG